MSWFSSEATASNPIINVADMYKYDDSGTRTYDVSKLNADQCDYVHATCTEEASYSRYKAIGVVVVGVAAAFLIGGAALITARIAAIFFIEIACVTGIPIYFNYYNIAIRLGIKTGVFTAAIFALCKLWNTTHHYTASHWNYAVHLDQQARDAILHKSLLNQAAQAQ